MKENHISVTKTARYHTLGELNEQTETIWFVCHGYGQLSEYFIKHFEAIDDGKTYIIAPEGLSRFYLGEFTGRVGATWLTKLDREHEIKDYINFFEQLLLPIIEDDKYKNVKFNFLGFSQGATTVCRFLAFTKFKRIDNLVMWAGSLPHDVSPELAVEVFGRVPVYIVYGDQDQFLENINMPEYEQKLKALGLNYEIVPFEGKHEMNKDVLIQLKQKTTEQMAD